MPQRHLTENSLSVTPTYEEFLEFASQCTIRSGTKYIPFSPLFEYQKAIAKLLSHYRGCAIVKDRQLGITEVLICWMLLRAKCNPAYASAVFSITERDAHKVSQRVKRMPARMSDFRWEVESVGIRKPENGGEMNFRPSTENATRGLESVWDLFFDEAGFIRIIDEMYAASTPSQEMVGEDARTLVVSTIPPEGLSCWFGELMEAGNPIGCDVESMLDIAKAGRFFNGTPIALPEIPGFCAWEDEGGWVKIAIGHKAHPIYGANPNYVEQQRVKKKLTEQQAQREHNLGLPKSGVSLFNLDKVTECAIGQWQPPHQGRNYLLCVDPNFGAIGNDFYVCQVWDITKLPIALAYEYRNNISGSENHRSKILNAIDAYNPVIAVFEGNGGGKPMAERIQSDRPRLQVEIVNTGRLSKIQNTDRVALMVEQNECIFPADWAGVTEMRKFSAKERCALSGHDDSTMCFATGMAYLMEVFKPVRHYGSAGAGERMIGRTIADL